MYTVALAKRAAPWCNITQHLPSITPTFQLYKFINTYINYIYLLIYLLTTIYSKV